MVQALGAWLALTEDQRWVIVHHGRPYFEMPPWRERRHREYPEHLREQVTALVICTQLGPTSPSFPLRGNPLSLLVRALDARKRREPRLLLL